MTPIETLAALAVANFPKFEGMVLAFLFAAQHGPEKQPGVFLHPIDLARIASCHPNSFRKAIKNLLACRVIVESQKDFFSFADDWESWLWKDRDSKDDPLSRRIGPADVEYVAHMKARFGTAKPSNHKRKSGAGRPQNSPTFGAVRPQVRPTFGAEWPHMDADGLAHEVAVTPDPPVTSDAAIACVGARPSEDKNIREKKRVFSSSTSTGEKTPIGGGRPTTIEALEAWAVETFDEQQYVPLKLKGWVDAYGVSDTFDALMAASVTNPRMVAPWVNTTLRNWHAEGKLPSQVAAKGEPAPKPLYADRVEAKRQKFRDEVAAMKERNAREAR